MYNLSGIQKGIQFAHAALEYAKNHGDDTVFQEFINYHKTIVILDGGGSNDMIERLSELKALGISTAKFYEPDLNDSLSAIVFIIPESVYSIDMKNPDWAVVDDYDYSVKDYLSKFRLASN